MSEDRVSYDVIWAVAAAEVTRREIIEKELIERHADAGLIASVRKERGAYESMCRLIDWCAVPAHDRLIRDAMKKEREGQ